MHAAPALPMKVPRKSKQNDEEEHSCAGLHRIRGLASGRMPVTSGHRVPEDIGEYLGLTTERPDREQKKDE